MTTVAEALYRDSEIGELQELPRTGTSLEVPLVYDSSARELKLMAHRGMVEIVVEHHAPGTEALIDRMVFKRVR